MQEEKSSVIHIRIPEEMIVRLDRLSESKGLTRSALVKFALKTLVEQMERNPNLLSTPFITEINRVADELKIKRATHYKPRVKTGSTCPQGLVAEPPANPWIDHIKKK
ncbi:MAG: ribbon-helix-helix protein, CopG family [Akkermansia sp.]